MNYEINVSYKNKHLFATHERSIASKKSLQQVLPIFRDKFPPEEGYSISVTLWEKRGKHISTEDLDEILEKSYSR